MNCIAAIPSVSSASRAARGERTVESMSFKYEEAAPGAGRVRNAEYDVQSEGRYKVKMLNRYNGENVSATDLTRGVRAAGDTDFTDGKKARGVRRRRFKTRIDWN